jgi:hypothetical protein
MPDGNAIRIKVRSMVGLLPLCAATVISGDWLEQHPRVIQRVRRFLERHPETAANINPPYRAGVKNRRLLSILNEQKLRRILSALLDEKEFFGPHGIRSLSKIHEDHPYKFVVHGEEYRVDYIPAESNTGMFGGNSNWRGPVWMPVNALILRALLQYYLFYGDDFKVECPTGSGKMMTLFEVSRELSNRLGGIFLRDEDGNRPVYGGSDIFQKNPHWRDLILFYEYFHGDNGAGIGASHQTGWTGVVARFMQLFAHVSAKQVLHDSDTRPVTVFYED